MSKIKLPNIRVVKEYININTTQELDKDDSQYIFNAITYYDMDDEVQENLTDKENDSFHHVYGLCKENGAI